MSCPSLTYVGPRSSKALRTIAGPELSCPRRRAATPFEAAFTATPAVDRKRRPVRDASRVPRLRTPTTTQTARDPRGRLATSGIAGPETASIEAAAGGTLVGPRSRGGASGAAH